MPQTELMKNWEKDQRAAQLRGRRNQEQRNEENHAMGQRARARVGLRELLLDEIDNETRDKIKRDCDAKRQELETRELKEFQEAEMSRKRDEDYALAKRRQLLRETDPDLKDLNRKLQAQYINRARDAQLLEKKLAKIRSENHKKNSLDIYNEPLQLNDDKEKAAEMARQYKLRTGLQDQLIEKQMRKQREYDEFLKERVEIDLATQRVHEEEQAAYQAKLDQTKRLREDMEAFKASQLVWRERQRAHVFAEEQKLREVNDSTEIEEQRRKDEKQRKLDEKDQIALKLASMKFERESRLAQQEKLVSELDALRIKDQQSRESKAQLAARLEQRAALRSTLLGQIAQRKAALQRDAALDAQMQQRVQDQMAEDVRLETLTKQKERIRHEQFCKDARVQMEEFRVQRATEMAEVIAEEKRIAENEAAENDFIRQERILMIAEHAAKLGSYFPKSLLKPSDLSLLGPDLVSQLGIETEPK